mmetsp:Transcript_5149/g.14396  ORF Transcript_5149/g.14396 Transcript_5149/m.14396 type:complete len:350 (-) Transcript_5149:965-2014(-)
MGCAAASIIRARGAQRPLLPLLDDVGHCVGSPDELRMVGVDIGGLDGEQVKNHLLSLRTPLDDEVLGGLSGSPLQDWEPREVARHALLCHSDKLLKHELVALQSWRLKFREGSAGQQFKRLLWDEQASLDPAAVLDRGPDILVAQLVARRQLVQAFHEYVLENVPDTSATGDSVDGKGLIVAVDHLAKGIGVFADEAKQKRALRCRGAADGRLSVAGQLRRPLVQLHFEGVAEAGQQRLDVLDQNRVEGLSQDMRSALIQNWGVFWMASKELLLRFPGKLHSLAGVDVVLAAVHHTNVSQPQGHHFVPQDVGGVSAPVHDVELCDNANCPVPLWVHLARQLERVGVRQV